MATRRRGLGDVLHYFISDEEQAQARARSAARDQEPPGPDAARGDPELPGPPVLSGLRERSDLAEELAELPRNGTRWCLPASPDRPLSCLLATELAAALARHAGRSLILAPFVPMPRPPRAAGVSWHAFAAEPDALGRELDRVADGVAVLIALPPRELPECLAGLGAGRVDGLILPLDAQSDGASRALALLRQLASRAPDLAIGVVIVDAVDATAEAWAFERLAHAARRQLGVSVERLGAIPNDPARYRSLLLGVSLLELTDDCPAARGLEALGSRLRAP